MYKSSESFSGQNIQPLSLEGDLSSNWENWLQQFKIFMRASKYEDEDDKRKVGIFLHSIGSDAMPIFNSFGMDIDTCKYQDLIDKFQSYCTSKINLTIQRHNFFTRSQKQEETIDEFVIALKNLSFKCKFENIRESLVRDIFIMGLNAKNQFIKQILLQEECLDLETAVKMAKKLEVTQQAQPLQNNTYIQTTSTMLDEGRQVSFQNTMELQFSPSTSTGQTVKQEKVRCHCGQNARRLIVKKKGPTQGKAFFKCFKCNFFFWDQEMKCGCKQIAVLRTTKKECPNKGRQFFTCKERNKCNFFQWLDEVSEFPMLQR